MAYTTTRTYTATPEFTSEGPSITVTIDQHMTTVSIADEYGNVTTMTEQQARNAARKILEITDDIRAEGE